MYYRDLRHIKQSNWRCSRFEPLQTFLVIFQVRRYSLPDSLMVSIDEFLVRLAQKAHIQQILVVRAEGHVLKC